MTLELNKIYLETPGKFEYLKQLPDNSIDLTVTSPPYDNIRLYKGGLVWNENIWKDVIKELYRVTKQGSVVVWVVGDATIKGSETGSSFKQALYAKDCGFRLHDTMIWRKTAIPGDPKCERYWAAFEYMFVWSKGKPTCNYIKVPCKNAGKAKTNDYGHRRIDGSKRTDRHNPSRVIKDTKVKDNVWDIGIGKRDGKHPATFPEQLAEDHILSWSNEGDTVLDPFIGSGTTAVACKKLNRHFIGMEIYQEYIDISYKRLEELKW